MRTTLSYHYPPATLCPPPRLLGCRAGVALRAGTSQYYDSQSCRAWTRTKIPSSRGMCPTIRRPGSSNYNFPNLLFKYALPNPVFNCFSLAIALTLDLQASKYIKSNGLLDFVEPTSPLLCIFNLLSISVVQPIYNLPSFWLIKTYV